MGVLTKFRIVNFELRKQKKLQGPGGRQLMAHSSWLMGIGSPNRLMAHGSWLLEYGSSNRLMAHGSWLLEYGLARLKKVDTPNSLVV